MDFHSTNHFLHFQTFQQEDDLTNRIFFCLKECQVLIFHPSSNRRFSSLLSYLTSCDFYPQIIPMDPIIGIKSGARSTANLVIIRGGDWRWPRPEVARIHRGSDTKMHSSIGTQKIRCFSHDWHRSLLDDRMLHAWTTSHEQIWFVISTGNELAEGDGRRKIIRSGTDRSDRLSTNCQINDEEIFASFPGKFQGWFRNSVCVTGYIIDKKFM